MAADDGGPATVTVAVSAGDNQPSNDTTNKGKEGATSGSMENETLKSDPMTSMVDTAMHVVVDQSSTADQQRKTSEMAKGRAIDFAPTVMSADRGVEPIIFVTSPPVMPLAASTVKGKSMKDLSDVSMDEMEDVEGGGSKEKVEDAAKGSDKECKAVST